MPGIDLVETGLRMRRMSPDELQGVWGRSAAVAVDVARPDWERGLAFMVATAAQERLAHGTDPTRVLGAFMASLDEIRNFSPATPAESVPVAVPAALERTLA